MSSPDSLEFIEIPRRSRRYVAHHPDIPVDSGSTKTAWLQECEVPILTEVVDGTPSSPIAGHLGYLEERLAVELDAWVTSSLPRHVERLLAPLHEQIVKTIARDMQTELLPRMIASLTNDTTSD